MRKKARTRRVSPSSPISENEVFESNTSVVDQSTGINTVNRQLSALQHGVNLIFADPFAENSQRRVEEISQINPQLDFKAIELNQKDIVAQITEVLQSCEPESVDSLWVVSGCEINSDERPNTHGFCSQLSWQKSDRRMGSWKKYFSPDAQAFVMGSGNGGFAEQIKQHVGIEVHGDFPSHPGPRFDEIVFVDGGVTNFEPVVRNILLHRDADVVLLDSQRDGLKQMADTLKNQKGLKSIHLICHGTPGVLVIGDTAINSQSIQGHSNSLATIGNALGKDGDVHIYGGSFNQGPAGMQTARLLSSLTGAFIIVSNAETELGLSSNVQSLAAGKGTEFHSMSPLDVVLPPMVFPKKSAGNSLRFLNDKAVEESWNDASQRIRLSYAFDAKQALGWLCIGIVVGFGIAMTLMKVGVF